MIVKNTNKKCPMCSCRIIRVIPKGGEGAEWEQCLGCNAKFPLTGGFTNVNKDLRDAKQLDDLESMREAGKGTKGKLDA